MNRDPIPEPLADILIVDDRPANLDLLSRILSEKGYKVRKTTSGRCALLVTQTVQPDLILLDIIMPDMNGYEVCSHLKASELTRDIPIIFISDLDDPKDKLLAFHRGGSDFIGKPFHEPEVLARVENQLKILRLYQQLQQQTQQLIKQNAQLQREIQERQQAQIETEKVNQKLERLVMSDGLTGVANRRKFDRYLSNEWRRAIREQHPLGLLMCDVDYFKRYNDTYGHLAGDDCLRAVAKALSRVLKRPGDLVARYGGEEFTIVLPNTDTNGAIHIAEKIQQSIEQLQLPHKQSPVSSHVTVSLGGIDLLPTPHWSPEVAISHADRLLYQAKQQGRNCYCIQSETLRGDEV